MKIEVKVKLILTVPEPKQDEFAGDIVLAVEQHINRIGYLVISETNTRVGIRLHISGKHLPKVTE